MEEKNKINYKKILINIITGTAILSLTAFIVIMLVVTFLPNSVVKVREIDETNLDEQMTRIKNAFKTLSETYIDELDISKIADGAIAGMAEATADPYTRYISQEEYDEMVSEDPVEYSGIGVHITYDEKSDGIIVLGVMPNSPAKLADVRPGDIIKKVDDLIITLSTYTEGVDAIKGTEGTTVNITIIRSNEQIEKTIERKKLQENYVSSEILDNDVGYIKIMAFETDISEQFKQEYDKLKSQNIKSLIIDLRDNPGGFVSETVKIANMLLPAGEIIKVVYGDGTTKQYNSDGKNQIDIPLVVLVNERSASASEILASAIKDTKVGTLVGTKTYGKGVIQTIEKIDGKGALAVTTAKYYTISGIEINKNGIEPDIEVDLDESVKNSAYINKENDSQLKKAIEVLLNK